ncbi:D-arabinitol 2-dehydrogenase [Colletotrichum orbiculare MAFF 240422]|uniref:D-arabinitol 2-dehydrogenase n=1 Tax=Colletotrichum orbiculare (strain 104-T / ATCC 96160 / CBS 514.97 / LARS 414 / MAFF 240422) TaxID=1213857 RepID=A0A484G4V5_COLOR|nr:D-arabinitol 2-dehydrogenase [Colletotrichum orbiculare MAFF 240422]
MLYRFIPRATRIAASRLANRSQAARPFSRTASRLKSDVVREKEIPVSVYAPDAKGTGQSDHFSIPVREHDSRPPTETPTPEPENNNVVPLTRKTYDAMPPMMQKLSCMNKTVAIVIFDANQELGDEAAAEMHQKTGLPVTFFKVDVRDGAAINAAVDSVVELYGAPDVLVNSAGIADSNIKAETYDPAMFRRLIDINLTGSFLVSQSVGRAMMKAGKGGSIILVASMSGSIVNYPQEQSCYNASKAGVIQFGKSLAAEWAKYNIRVNCISPGYMDTALNRVPALDAQKKIWKSLTPQDRLGGVDDLNGLCVFLASDASSFMTGSNVIIDGGYTCY